MRKKKIVIIDDEEDLCRLMKTYFIDLNHEVYLAFTLKEGLSLMMEVAPDVLFIDNNLPDGLGWEKMPFILEKFPTCKVNLISAYDYLPPEIKNERIDAVKIIEKPLSLNTLKNYL